MVGGMFGGVIEVFGKAQRTEYPEKPDKRQRREDEVNRRATVEGLILGAAGEGACEGEDRLGALERDDQSLDHLAGEDGDARMVRYVGAIRQARVHHGFRSVPALRSPEDGIGGRHVSSTPSASADPSVCNGRIAPQDRRGIVLNELLVQFGTALRQVGGVWRAGEDRGNQGG